MMRLLRPTRSGIFLRSFRLHSAHYARETIAKICSLWVIALRSPCSAQARGDHAESSRGTFKEEALLAEGCLRMRGRGADGTFIHERPVRPYRAPVSAAPLRASPPARTCGNLPRPFH